LGLDFLGGFETTLNTIDRRDAVKVYEAKYYDFSHLRFRANPANVEGLNDWQGGRSSGYKLFNILLFLPSVWFIQNGNTL